jgi:hypothetical protein
MKYSRRFLVLAALVSAAVGFACGSRTGLLVPEGSEPGSGSDAGVLADALPTIDATPNTDGPPPFCGDAAQTLVYVVTNTSKLLRFDPLAARFSLIGTLACPDPRQPFSMAVDHEGVAYVLYSTGDPLDSTPGDIYRVSLATAECQATRYVPSDARFSRFGMGFAADRSDAGETLFVASSDPSLVTGDRGALDTTAYRLRDIATFSPPVVVHAELSGTGDGRLFAFFEKGDGGSAIAQVDPTSAKVIAEDDFPRLDQGDAWAFAFWGGDFYLFTAPGDGLTSRVTRFRPSDGTQTTVATYPEPIVGAGVSTCAPER